MASIDPVPFPRSSLGCLGIVLPGIGLSLVVALGAFALHALIWRFIGVTALEPLVLAILLGTIIRTLWSPSSFWRPGIGFSAKILLEIAVVFLGASISAHMILAAGIALPLAIALTVVLSIFASLALSRLLGLPTRMGVLIACGNAICGNSAITAVAPVIGANGKDVAASIAFTAVLGVVVVLALPVVGLSLGLAPLAGGALAGLTVYAVPQVLAAAAPFGTTAVQLGTFVKLVRVLMLGPVCIVLSIVAPRLRKSSKPGTCEAKPQKISVFRLVPWFILGFLALMLMRTFGAIPEAMLKPIADVATVLTVMAMAALGLGVDIRTVARAGRLVSIAVTLSLIALLAISLVLIYLLDIGSASFNLV